MSEHTKEWWEGYAWQGPRNHNPYQGNPETDNESMSWLFGWLCRFFGEDP